MDDLMEKFMMALFMFWVASNFWWSFYPVWPPNSRFQFMNFYMHFQGRVKGYPKTLPGCLHLNLTPI